MTTMIVIILMLAQFRFYSHGCLLLASPYVEWYLVILALVQSIFELLLLS